MKFHKITMEKTHNLEVPGSSPGWSTTENQALTSFSQVLFSCLRKQCVNKLFQSPLLCHR